MRVSEEKKLIQNSSNSSTPLSPRVLEPMKVPTGSRGGAFSCHVRLLYRTRVRKHCTLSRTKASQKVFWLTC